VDVLLRAISTARRPSGAACANASRTFRVPAERLGGLLFDQGFGLLATAPVLVFAFAGSAHAPARSRMARGGRAVLLA
jgi:hypothetical protein